LNVDSRRKIRERIRGITSKNKKFHGEVLDSQKIETATPPSKRGVE